MFERLLGLELFWLFWFCIILSLFILLTILGRSSYARASSKYRIIVCKGGYEWAGCGLENYVGITVDLTLELLYGLRA
jgi:hypothetical protein